MPVSSVDIPQVPVPKGKVATKGQKMIVEENIATLNHYLYMMAVSNGIYFLAQYFFFWDSFTIFYILLSIFTSAVFVGCYKFMQVMSKATYDQQSGLLLDGGIDLCMPGGMAEHTKDIIILTSALQVLSLLSNYFWLLYLLAPIRAFYMLWTNILAPWFFAEAPEEDVKKTKKMERKMKRR